MKNDRLPWILAVSFCAAAPLGCAGQDNLHGGNQGAGGSAATDGGNTVVGSQLSNYAASWDGYAQAYAFAPDGSDRIRLTIDTNGQGTLRIGESALLAPPTDPSVGYPPGDGGSTATPPGDSTLAEGFLYPLHATQVQTDRIQLGIDPNDLDAAWCALQTPVAIAIVDDNGPAVAYGCLPGGPSMTSGDICTVTAPDGGSQSIDCGKYWLCNSGACRCTATSCAATAIPDGTPVTGYPVEIDGALDATGSTLTGTLVLPDARVTVVLQRQ